MASRNDLFRSAWYVEYVDDNGREQLVTYMHCADALKAFHALERPARFGLLFSNGSTQAYRMQAYSVKKEVPNDGEA